MLHFDSYAVHLEHGISIRCQSVSLGRSPLAPVAVARCCCRVDPPDQGYFRNPSGGRSSAESPQLQDEHTLRKGGPVDGWESCRRTCLSLPQPTSRLRADEGECRLLPTGALDHLQHGHSDRLVSHPRYIAIGQVGPLSRRTEEEHWLSGDSRRKRPQSADALEFVQRAR